MFCACVVVINAHEQLYDVMYTDNAVCYCGLALNFVLRFSLYPDGIYGHAGSGSVSDIMHNQYHVLLTAILLCFQGGYLEHIFKYAAFEVMLYSKVL